MMSITKQTFLCAAVLHLKGVQAEKVIEFSTLLNQPQTLNLKLSRLMGRRAAVAHLGHNLKRLSDSV